MIARSIVGAAAALAVAATPAGAAVPRVDQLVAFRNGDAEQQSVKAAGTKVRVGRKTCAVASGTPLSALARSGLPGIKLKDYGSCSKRAADAAGLYVSRIRKDAAKGLNGWVYKVGNKVATAGAGDSSGPFGSGLLKPGTRVTWFYCRMKASGCQRTLVAKPEPISGGRLRVTVRAYDDRGKSRPAAGATVHADGATATTDSHGVATLSDVQGSVAVYATAKGLVRSFEERIGDE
jgi:hypothetical protein